MEFTLPVEVLQAALLFAAKKDVRYYLNGIHFGYKDGFIEVVATDGCALFAARVKTDQDLNGLDVIIPRDAVSSVGKSGSVGIVLDGDNVEVSYGASTITTKPIDGNFPAWRRIVPASTTGEAARLDPKYMVAAEKAAKALKLKDTQLTYQFNGKGGAIVQFNGCEFQAFAIIMPFRNNDAAADNTSWARG